MPFADGAKLKLPGRPSTSGSWRRHCMSDSPPGHVYRSAVNGRFAAEVRVNFEGFALRLSSLPVVHHCRISGRIYRRSARRMAVTCLADC